MNCECGCGNQVRNGKRFVRFHAAKVVNRNSNLKWTLEKVTEVFWTRVRKTETCWIWEGYKDANGYGKASWNGRHMWSHRMAFILTRGYEPVGLDLDHLCKNPICCNPDHLDPVTHTVNVQRALLQTHCKRGHKFTPENSYYRPDRKPEELNKMCRTCLAQRAAARMKRIRANPILHEAHKRRVKELRERRTL